MGVLLIRYRAQLTLGSALNMIRMIKLFGWESKVYKQIEGKRDEELHWIRKRTLLNLLNGNIKYASSLSKRVI